MAKKGIIILGAILAVSIAGGALFVGWLAGNDWRLNEEPQQITPELDGVIKKQEWLRCNYYNVPFHLDVDNAEDPVEGKRNVDGWNYISVGEDEDYYYVALDLCSDRTNNKEGEWIAFEMLNRMPDSDYGKLAFAALEDYGFEYFFYNVSDGSVFDDDYFTYPGTETSFDIPLVPEYDNAELLRGNAIGHFEEIWEDMDERSLTISSSHYDAVPAVWTEGHFFAVQFGVNITEKMPDEAVAHQLSNISEMKVRLQITSEKTADWMNHGNDADEFYFSVVEQGGMPGDMDVLGWFFNQETLDFEAGEYKYLESTLDHPNINSTTGMFYFSVYGYNEVNATHNADFTVELDKLSLNIRTAGLSSVVGTSLEATSYDIAYSYGSSDNCDEDHRMFEFKVAKSEFPDLDDDFFYLSISGYGTMALAGTNYWVYPDTPYNYPAIYTYATSRLQFQTFDMSLA